MHDLEPGFATTVDGAQPPDVARLTVQRRVLDDDVVHFKDPKREGVLAVLADRLEQPGEERSPHDLVLDRFRVGENDGDAARVGPVQELEVFVVRALPGEGGSSLVSDSSTTHARYENEREREGDSPESGGAPQSSSLRSRSSAACH
jgi:hypothetical protein